MEAKLESYQCDRAVDVTYQWMIQKLTSNHVTCNDVTFTANSFVGVGGGGGGGSEMMMRSHENGRVVVFPPVYFLPGNYCVDVSVSFPLCWK